MQEEKLSESEATGSGPGPFDNLEKDEGSSLAFPPRCRLLPHLELPWFSLFRVSNEKVAEPDKLLSSLASCTQKHKRRQITDTWLSTTQPYVIH